MRQNQVNSDITLVNYNVMFHLLTSGMVISCNCNIVDRVSYRSNSNSTSIIVSCASLSITFHSTKFVLVSTLY